MSENEEILDVEIEETQSEALLAVLSDIGSNDDVMVTIYRAEGHKGQHAYIKQCSPEEFSLDELRDKFGGGTFKIMVREKGRIVKGGNRIIAVEKKIEPENNTEDILSKLLQTQEQSKNNDFNGGLKAIAEMINQQNQQNQQMLIMMMERMNNNVSPQQQMQDTMNLLATMKQLFPEQRKEDSTDVLLKGIEIASRFNSEKGESSTMDAIIESIRTFGKPIAEAASIHNRQLLTQTPNNLINGKEFVSSGVQIPGNYTAQKSNKMSPNSEVNNMKFIIVQKIKELIRQAQANKDVNIYADLIIDNLPEEQINAFINKENWFTEICSYVPEAAQYQAWFEKLKISINEGLTEQDYDDTISDNGPEPLVITPAGSFNENNEPNF
ncbi:MAG: hypothetical protein ACFFG0_17780 [Candidatus Thorarchaeota archaeon]